MLSRNEWEIRIFGMRRSGHHAVAIWLAHHFPHRSVHFMNDVVPFKDPFTHHVNTRPTTKKGDCFVDRSENDIAGERSLQKKCLMYNYEDFYLPRLATNDLLPRKEQLVGNSDREFDVLVLRDPFNLAASRTRFRKGRWPVNWFSSTVELWLDYAKEYLGHTNYLRHKIVINYNKWFSDATYRKQLSHQIGLEFSDKGLNRVSGSGKGSSWDGMRDDRNAQKMKVLDRWHSVIHDSEFRSLFHKRYDVRDISEAIFGIMPRTRDLFDIPYKPVVRFHQTIRQGN